MSVLASRFFTSQSAPSLISSCCTLNRVSHIATSASLDVFVIGFEGVLYDTASGKLYEGVAAALSSTSMPYYVVSSMPGDAVSETLRSQANVDIPSDSPRLLAVGEKEKLQLLELVSTT